MCWFHICCAFSLLFVASTEQRSMKRIEPDNRSRHPSNLFTHSFLHAAAYVSSSMSRAFDSNQNHCHRHLRADALRSVATHARKFNKHMLTAHKLCCVLFCQVSHRHLELIRIYSIDDAHYVTEKQAMHPKSISASFIPCAQQCLKRIYVSRSFVAGAAPARVYIMYCSANMEQTHKGVDDGINNRKKYVCRVFSMPEIDIH